MTLTTAFLATTLFVPAMPPPEYDDCEVVTNCVFDASRGDAKMFVVLVLRTQAVHDAARVCSTNSGHRFFKVKVELP